MTRRKWIICLLLLAMVALGGTYGVLWWTAPTPGLTEDNLKRLRTGMTLQEVETLFGYPKEWWQHGGSTYHLWEDCENHNNLRVIVCFDMNRELTSASVPIDDDGRYWRQFKINEPFLERLRRMFRL